MISSAQNAHFITLNLGKYMLRFPQLSLLGLLTLIAALWTLAQNEGEFTGHEIELYSLYIALILSGQLLCVGTFIWAKKCAYAHFFDILSRIIAALFASFNAYTLLIIHNGRFSGLEEPYWTLFIIALTLAAAIPFFIHKPPFVKFLHIFCMISLVMSLMNFSSNYKDFFRDSLQRLPDTFTVVDFKKKPNIYIISFDAMVPESIARNIIGVSDVPYVQTLKDMKARFIPNSFAEPIPTKFSLNAVLAMDLAYYSKINNKRALVPDIVPTPGYELFRQNGYKIQFMYKTSYFGESSSRLDYYSVAEKNGLCQHVEKSYSFMGFCTATVQSYIATLIDTQNHAYPDMLFERIKTTAATKDHWFTYAYIYAPGHSKNSFNPYKKEDWQQYRKSFPRQAKRAAGMVKTLITTIKTHDPEAILIIFGDHGAMTSRGLLNDTDRISEDARAHSANKIPSDSPLTFAQIVQDRHGVINAIYPAKACKEYFKQNPFSIVRTLRELSKCLSDGQDPLPKNYQPNDNAWRDYIYE